MLSSGEREQARAMADMFHRLAPAYDRANRFISLGGDRRWRRRAAAEALKDRPGLVLDLATGTGDMALTVARQGGEEVVGMDLCPDMLALARSKVERRVALLLGHVLELPFKGESFDAVTIGFALRDIPSLPGTFRECCRVLRPGGRLVCLELSQPRQGAFWLYRFYMNRVMPVLGRWLGAEGTDYRFLSRSAARFPEPSGLARLMEAAGFRQVRFQRLALGAVAIHSGCKDHA